MKNGITLFSILEQNKCQSKGTTIPIKHPKKTYCVEDSQLVRHSALLKRSPWSPHDNHSSRHKILIDRCFAPYAKAIYRVMALNTFSIFSLWERGSL